MFNSLVNLPIGGGHALISPGLPLVELQCGMDVLVGLQTDCNGRYIPGVLCH